jgi:Zn-dependent protease with chaperone function
VKLAVFVAAFVAGSAVLLAATMIALPGYLLAWGATPVDYGDSAAWYAAMPTVIGIAFLLMVLIGGLLAAVQLSNSEDWVRSRFKGRDPAPGEAGSLKTALEEMSLAAGLPKAPRLIVLPGDTVNAFAIGTRRTDPAIGVTEGLLARLDENEERAVVAVLVARIIAGDIMFGTALAALMGPLKTIRDSGKWGADGGCIQNGCASLGDGWSPKGCGDGCGGCISVDDDDAAHLIVVLLFFFLVAVITYTAVVVAAWIVTIWGRALHRTSYEKADAEGMLLLKDPQAMLSALGKSMTESNELLDGDPSYDGILYAATSGNKAVSKSERRRFRRLAEVLGVDGAQAEMSFSARNPSS